MPRKTTNTAKSKTPTIATVRANAKRKLPSKADVLNAYGDGGKNTGTDSGLFPIEPTKAEYASNVLAKCKYCEPGFPTLWAAIRMVEENGKRVPRPNYSDRPNMSYGFGIAGTMAENVEHTLRMAEIAVEKIYPWLYAEYETYAPQWEYILPAEKNAKRKEKQQQDG